MKMLALVAAAVFVLTGCATAAERVTEDRFAVTNVEGTKCIVWKPNAGSTEGAQMECDFR